MKTGFLITARLKSTRLPLKIIKQVNGREFIRQMIDRLKLAQDLSNIIICTSTNPQDAVLETIAKEEGIDIFLGSEEDVILRLFEAAKKFKLDYAINITADCPLVAYEYVPLIIRHYEQTKADFIRCLDLPHGLFSYGISVESMQKICEIKDSGQTEVWSKYFTDTDYFKTSDLAVPEYHRRKYRLTLDYPEDFDFFQTLYSHFGNDTYRLTVTEIVDYLDANPEVVKINIGCHEKYLKRWNEQSKIKLQEKRV